MSGEKKQHHYARCAEAKKWQAYQAGLLGETEQMEMETHLLTCESCLQTYLGLLEDHLNSDKESLPKLGADFTDRVIDQAFGQIQVNSLKQNKVKTNAKETRNNKVNILISYCAAASIAMFFWVGGYFEGLSGSFDKGMDYMKSAQSVETKVESGKGLMERGFMEKSLIQTGWTQRLSEEDRPSFIENLILKKE